MKYFLLPAFLLCFSSLSYSFGLGGDNLENNQGQSQGQLQGQAQGQGQGQAQFSRNSNSNRNNAVGVGVGVAGAYSDGSTADNSMSLNQNYEAYDRDNTPDAYAPPLTTSNGTCMGSSSVGGSGPGLGLSVGSTWKDDSCTHRYNAKMLHDMGYKGVAVRIMCREKSVAESAIDLCKSFSEENVAVQKKPTVKAVADNGFF